MNPIVFSIYPKTIVVKSITNEVKNTSNVVLASFDPVAIRVNDQ
jgi:hypothetical protein